MYDRVEPPEDGYYENIPASEYHNWDALSQSMVPSLLISDHAFHEHMVSLKKSNAITHGKVLESLLLEPDNFDNEFHVHPPVYPGTEKGKSEPVNKKWIASAKYCENYILEYANRGIICISEDMKDRVMTAVRTIKAHYPLAVSALYGHNAMPQLSVVWTQYGVKCKARYDVFQLDVSNISDLKSTNNPMEFQFKNKCGRFYYHVQAGMYTESAEIIFKKPFTFKFVAVQDSAPYTTLVYAMRNDSIVAGRKAFKEAAARYKYLLETDFEKWEGYNQEEEIDIDVPAYLLDNSDTGEDHNHREVPESHEEREEYNPVLDSIDNYFDDWSENERY